MKAAEIYDAAFLTSLIDHRREEPDIEYKAWLDLSSPEARAKIAKHLCALSNFGGGWLVFGIANDGSYSEPHPENLQGYHQDTINGIVDKYLAPAFHCQVYNGTSSVTGKLYPIVRVPPHGVTPICAKANGPIVGKTISGVAQGVHYIRVPGPKSVPVESPSLWRELIHRCVVNERESLLGSIGRLFDRPAQLVEANALDQLIMDAESLWIDSVPESGWPADPKTTRTIFAFRLLGPERQRPEPLALKALQTALRQASNVADAAIQQGWSFFLESGGAGQRPKVTLVNEVEGYEALMVADGDSFSMTPTLWRAMIDGTGFEIRLQDEDSSWLIDAVNARRSRVWLAGDRLAPILQLRRAWQFLAFVRAFASNFPDAVSVQLSVDYKGLAGRSLDDPMPGRLMGFYPVAHVDQRREKIESSVEALAGDGINEAAIKLLSPIIRLFDGHDISSGGLISRLHK
ncbi:ATP-binding protein [Mesorhizobium sp. CA10]|uniref:AlbA family DNA-binding domain-containing protein n=1 Tax=Mesorhizobium sp. CA10 TaxID=588495 RepID=UPI001CCF8491|nr:ATP-binding protein [Mesorhizobium sp. CA10]MBZ9884824.1 ATP-binding protein [Mesorhizobium sp. CA10]